MSKHTPTLMFGALVEVSGLLTLFMVARGSDGSYSPPIVGFAAFLILCGTVVTIRTAIQISAEKRQG